jgi:uncharacterized membrane protein
VPLQAHLGLRDAPGGTHLSRMLQRMVDLAATGFEAGGTLAMAVGAVVALLQVFVGPARAARDFVLEFRQRLGRAIILGLELLVAADILRTVSVRPTLNEVLVLGIIVAIRTFLSFSLEVELKGRWPWQGTGRRPEDLR